MVALIPGKPCQGVEAVEQKDAEGQTWDQSLQQHPTLNPCRLNPHIWAGRMTPKRGPPSPQGLPTSTVLCRQPRAHERFRNGEFHHSLRLSGCILGKQ